MWASEHRRPLRIIIILGITANRRIAAHFLLAFTLFSKISVIAYADDGCHFLFEILTHFRIHFDRFEACPSILKHSQILKKVIEK